MAQKYIFLLGRPGCGKSFIFNRLSAKFKAKNIAEEFQRIDDFPILKELLDKDVKFERHIEKDGGFAVTDWTIVDEVLQVIDNRLSQVSSPKKIIFIEFARDNYEKALKNFSPTTLKNSVVLYIKTSFETCMKRNEERFKRRKDLDDHIVPPDLMESYYKTDDIEQALLKNQKLFLQNIFVLCNDNITPEELELKLEEFIKFYLSYEHS